MKVSIITVCYNSANTIETAIQSVLSQNYDNIEYIIVDGLSSDNTLQVIEPYKDKIAKVISEKDHGIYDAINKGIRAASGDLIGLLHSDDFLANSDTISNIAKKIQQEKTDSIYADLQYIDKDDTNKVIRNWVSGEYQEGLFLKGWMPPHPTFYVKKWVYDTFGNYNLELKSAADYEFMLRVLHKRKISVTYLPELTVKMRVGGMSNASLKNRLNANKEDRRAWKINNIKPKWYTIYAKPISKIKQFFK